MARCLITHVSANCDVAGGGTLEESIHPQKSGGLIFSFINFTLKHNSSFSLDSGIHAVTFYNIRCPLFLQIVWNYHRRFLEYVYVLTTVELGYNVIKVSL
jgi:hypothetical protein